MCSLSYASIRSKRAAYLLTLAWCASCFCWRYSAHWRCLAALGVSTSEADEEASEALSTICTRGTTLRGGALRRVTGRSGETARTGRFLGCLSLAPAGRPRFCGGDCGASCGSVCASCGSGCASCGSGCALGAACASSKGWSTSVASTGILIIDRNFCCTIIAKKAENSFKNKLKTQRSPAQIHRTAKPIGKPKIHCAAAAAARQIVVRAVGRMRLNLRANALGQRHAAQDVVLASRSMVVFAP